MITATFLFGYIAKPYSTWPSVHTFLHGQLTNDETVQGFDGHAGVARTSESRAGISAGVLHHDFIATGVLQQ